MASSDSDLQLVVRAIDEATSVLEKVRSEVSSTATATQSDFEKINAASQDSQTHISSLGGELTKLAAIVGAGALAKDFADFGISSASGLQSTNTNMQLLIGNTQQANKVMGDLYTFSRNTPFTFPEVADAAKTLLQYGATAQNVLGITEQLGNVVAVTGANYQHLADIYGQVNAAGKIQMNDVQQLTENGVPIMQEMAKVTGTSMAQISQDMLNSSVSAQVFDKAMQEIAPSNALSQMADNLTTRMSSLQGALRSVAFEILGINIDPIRGFVVEAGGLFDELSTGVENLAKELRSPEIQAAMTQLGAAIDVLASTILPVLLDGLKLVADNLGVIIPLVVGLATAFGVIKVAGLISDLVGLAQQLYMTATASVTLEGALGVIGVVVGALAGGAMFELMQQMGNVQSSMGQTVGAVKSGSDDIGMSAENGLGKASQAAQDLSSKLADISDEMQKSTRDFNESLAQIAETHKSKIADLTDQINQEKEDFTKSQQDRTDTFKENQAEQLQAHQDTVQQIQDQIDQETAKGRFADQAQLQDLQDHLAKENDAYTQQVAKNQATYGQDTQNAQDSSNDKLTSLQTQLNTENAFMQKHAADLSGIRASDALDEIDQLKQSHADQMKEYEKQKNDVVSNAQQQTLGISNAMAPLPVMAGNIGNQMGAQMANQFKQAFKDSISDLYNWWSNWVLNTWDPWITHFGNTVAKAFDNATGLTAVGTDVSNILKMLHVPGFATGGVVPGPVGSPMLAVVHGGEVVTPPGQKFGGNANNVSGGTNFNFTVIGTNDPYEIAREVVNQTNWSLRVA